MPRFSSVFVILRNGIAIMFICVSRDFVDFFCLTFSHNENSLFGMLLNHHIRLLTIHNRYESTYNAIFRLCNTRYQFPYNILYYTLFHWTSIRQKLDMTEATIWYGTFGGRFAHKKHAIKVYNDRIN
jgi:hypothetical protein